MVGRYYAGEETSFRDLGLGAREYTCIALSLSQRFNHKFPAWTLIEFPTLRLLKTHIISMCGVTVNSQELRSLLHI